MTTLNEALGDYQFEIVWNCQISNSDKNVIATLVGTEEDQGWISAYRPDVVKLSEASSHHDALVVVARRTGYRLLQEQPAPHQPRGDDTGDCAMLVAPWVEVQRDWVARMRKRWLVLSHHRWHKPHKYQTARLKIRGRVWRNRASHWPTHGLDGPNGAAALESARSSRRWLRAGLGVPSVDSGDLNDSLARLAAWFGQRFRVFGKGVDVAVTLGVKGCDWRELGKGGGDHHGRRYRYYAEAKR